MGAIKRHRGERHAILRCLLELVLTLVAMLVAMNIVAEALYSVPTDVPEMQMAGEIVDVNATVNMVGVNATVNASQALPEGIEPGR